MLFVPPEFDHLRSENGKISSQNTPKSNFFRGSAPNPAGGAYSAPPDPLAGGKGARCPLPKNPTPRSQPFGLRASALRASLRPPTFCTVVTPMVIIVYHQYPVAHNLVVCETLFSLYSGRAAIAQRIELKTSSSETGIHVLQFRTDHLVDVGRSLYEVIPVVCGRTHTLQPVCWC